VSDADLVARARAGDSAAFGELVDRHRTAVFRAALAALGSHADADDAAQEAFVTAYQRLDTFRGDASFKTWLLTIAWHQAINRRRSLARWWTRTVTMTPADDAANRPWFEPVSDSATPEQTAATRQLRQALVVEIRSLPVKLRDALLLAQSGEYTYSEMGAILKAPAGTIKWRVSEARRAIKARLQRRGFVDVG